VSISLLCVLVVAVLHDLRERRIPNFLVVGGIVIALLVSAIDKGLGGIGSSLTGMLLGMALFLPFFALRLIGAGDVKLFGVVGGFVGVNALLMVWFYTLLAGGVLGVVSILLARSAPQFFRNMKLLLISMTYRVQGVGMSLEEMATQTSVRIPYAVAIAAGVVIWMVRQS